MNAHLANLQEQVDSLYASLNALRNGGDAISFGTERSMSVSAPQPVPVSPLNKYRPAPRRPQFRGPTSSAFSLDVAKNTLHNMGYQGLGDEGMVTQDATPATSPPPSGTLALARDNGSIKDPIWSISKEEMIRLCRVYEEEMGLMYPVLDIEQVITHGRNLYEYVGAALRTGLASDGSGINDERTLTLKMVLACATATEGQGQSEIAYRLFESNRDAADRLLHSEVIEVKNLPFLVLVVSSNFTNITLLLKLQY